MAIPVYVMPNTWIPNSSLLAIEKICCRFIWGDKKIHAVSWKIITKLKYKGGLGVHDMVKWRTALLAKHAGKVMAEALF